MAYYLSVVPSEEKEKNQSQRYAFFKACYSLRDLYLMNLDKYCYCKNFEGPVLPNGQYLNCGICKAAAEFDFFHLQCLKEDLSALKRLYLKCEKMNFSMVLDHIPPFWLNSSYEWKVRSQDVSKNLLNFIFVFRSQIIAGSGMICVNSVAKNFSCKCPKCHFKNAWNMFNLQACLADFEQLKAI